MKITDILPNQNQVQKLENLSLQQARKVIGGVTRYTAITITAKAIRNTSSSPCEGAAQAYSEYL